MNVTLRKGKNTMAEEIMTIEEYAKYRKTSISPIYRLAQEGKIPASKVGNQWRVRKEKIDEWLDKGEGGIIDEMKNLRKED